MRVQNIQVMTSENVITYSAEFIFRKNWMRPQEWLSFFRPKTPFTLRISIPAAYGVQQQYPDAFFLVAVALALNTNQSLVFDGPVSGEALQISEKLRAYYDYGTAIKPIIITHRLGVVKRTVGVGAAQFLSLGVDSFYSLLCERRSQDAVKHVIFVDGLDVPLLEGNFLKKLHQRVRQVTDALSLEPVFVQTNIRELSDPIVGWGLFHVSALVAVAQVLPFARVTISGESFDALDWGLRSGVDTLFSTSSPQIALSGHAMSRRAKVEALLQNKHAQLFLDHVRVCWQNIEQAHVRYNCSRCQKCLRTQLMLRACGAKVLPTFSHLNLRDVEQLRLAWHVRSEWQEIYQLLSQQPRVEKSLVRSLKKILAAPPPPLPPAYRQYQL